MRSHYQGYPNGASRPFAIAPFKAVILCPPVLCFSPMCIQIGQTWKPSWWLLTALDQYHVAEPLDAVCCLGDLGGYAVEPNDVQDLVMALGYLTVLGNFDERVGFDCEDCGGHCVTPFDSAMREWFFTWTRAHPPDDHKSLLRALPWAIRLEAKGAA